MQRKNNSTSENPGDPALHDPNPTGKRGKGFLERLKKVGFTVWLAVMVIGGALAFLVALFLV